MFGDAFGDDFEADFAVDAPDAKKKKKKEKRHKSKDPDADVGRGPEEDGAAGGFGAAGASAGGFDACGGLGEPAGWAPAATVGGSSGSRGGVLESGLAYLSAALDSDAAVSQQIQGSVDRMDDELRELRQYVSRLQEEVEYKTEEADYAAAEQKVFENRLRDARHRVAHLHADRHGIGMGKLNLVGERSLCAGELDLLAELEALAEKDLLDIKRLNNSAEAAIGAMEARAAALESQRREVLLEVVEERRRFKQELQAFQAAQREFEGLQSEELKEQVDRQRRVMRSAFHDTARKLREAEGGGAAFGATGPPPAPSPQIFEGHAAEHIRRHLAAGRPSSDPLDV